MHKRVHAVISSTEHQMLKSQLCPHDLRSKPVLAYLLLCFLLQMKLLLTAPAHLLVFGFEELISRSNWTSIRKKSEHTVVGVTTVELDTLKGLRREAECHFATLGMTILVGALRR